jgi:putative oxidoreductase
MNVNFFNHTFFIRFAAATILLSHSLHGILFDNDIVDFGNLFLNKIGFAPFGVFIAWSVVILQVSTSLFLLINQYTKLSAAINIVILLAGIVTVHFKEGWFVVGAGRNGMEFSFLLIFVLLAVMFPNGFAKAVPQSKKPIGKTNKAF